MMCDGGPGGLGALLVEPEVEQVSVGGVVADRPADSLTPIQIRERMDPGGRTKHTLRIAREAERASLAVDAQLLRQDPVEKNNTAQGSKHMRGTRSNLRLAGAQCVAFGLMLICTRARCDGGRSGPALSVSLEGGGQRAS